MIESILTLLFIPALILWIAMIAVANNAKLRLFNYLYKLNKDWKEVFVKTTFLYRFQNWFHDSLGPNLNRPDHINPTGILLIKERKRIIEKYNDEKVSKLLNNFVRKYKFFLLLSGVLVVTVGVIFF